MKRVLNSRPIFFIALLFMAGVASSYYMGFEVAPLIYALIAAAICFAVLLFAKWPRALLALYAAAFLAGGLLFQLQYNVDFSAVEVGDYAISGRVADVQRGSTSKYTVADVRLSAGGEVMDFSKDVLLYSKALLGYGDLIEFNARVEPPSTVRNPGGFDAKMYAAANGAVFSCFADQVRVYGNTPDPYGFFLAVREVIADRIDEYFSVETAPVAKAMFLGAKGELPEQLQEDFGITGIAHVLAISGLHIGIIALLMQLAFKKLNMPRRLRFPLSIGILLCYALLTGLAPSVVRAVIMFSLLLLGRWLLFERDTLTFLSAAALITLAFRTPQLFMPGFLMSYGVVFGLLCLMPPIGRFLRRHGRAGYIAASLGTSGAASLSAFPLTAYYFNSVSLGAVIANFFAVPLTTLIVLFTGLFALLCFTPLAAALAVPPQLFAELLVWLNGFFARVELGYILTRAFPVVAGVLVFALLFICSDYVMLRQKIKAGVCVLLAALVAVCWIAAFDASGMDGFYVNILDVGTGDIAHIHTPEGDYLIDGGGNPQRAQLTEYSENNRLTYDFALVTNDRTNDLADIAEQGRVEGMLVPANFARKDYDKKIPMKEYDLYDKIELGGGVSIKIVAGNEKYHSVMIYDREKPVCLLAQNAADELRGVGEAYAVKPAGGGRAGSVSEAMLARLRPRYAVLSVKGANKQGLPDVSALALLKNGAQVYSTAESGAVTIYRSGDGYKIKTMK